MGITVPIVPTESLRAWYDSHHVDAVVLHDMTEQAARSLAALLIERRRTATDAREREHWDARLRLVRQQQAALDPDNRAGLIAQQQAWLEEADALTPVASPHG
jgi:hypothetical protein